MAIKNRPLLMRERIWLYITGFLLGLFILQLSPSIIGYLLPQGTENAIIESTFTAFILTFPLVTVNWLIKNRDISQQLKYSLQQQNEALFSNSLQLLFKKEDGIARSAGLKELVELKQGGKIDSKRIDTITSSGLQLEKASLQKTNLQGANLQGANLQEANLQGANLQGANLQRANLQGANLQGANLQRANLQGANLQGANLQGANLQGTELTHSRYNEKTIFSDGFDPKQRGMILTQEQDK